MRPVSGPGAPARPSTGPRKKGVGARLWLVVDSTGQAEVVEAGKHSIMRRTGLPGRDLRILDPLLSYPSTVLGREGAIVINLEHIKAIITANEVLLLNFKDPAVAPFVQELQYKIQLHHAKREGRDLPFEFVALEACLEAACSCLENEAKTLEKEAHPALDKLASKISTLNLEHVRQIKSRLVAISGRVQKVRDELEQLLDDDDDMAEMYLTDKLMQQNVASRSSSLSSLDDDEEDIVDERFPEEISSEQNYIQNNFEGNYQNIGNQGRLLSRLDSYEDGHGPRTCSTGGSKHLEVQELEMLLEAYFVQIDGTLNNLSAGLKTAIIEGDVIGGTCVNRGCVPSKALLAVSGRMRELQNEHHMKALGLQVAAAGYDRQGVADHANNLASKIRSNLTNSLKALGVDILTGTGSLVSTHKVKFGDTEVTARDIIIATGSVPFVPKGIEVDGKTVITSDQALKLEWVPEWIAIVGSGYIGLEFSDVYTALGSEVTFIEALDQLMPGFDPEIGKLAQRILVNPRKIDYHTGVFATKITPAKDGNPVRIELIDAKTKEPKETLEVDAALIATGRSPFTQGLGLENINVVTQRGFVPVNERMQVMDASGNLVPHLYCIGDANGKMMLAHAASAQGISVVENICGKDNVLNHLSIPAACFTHPEISMVGLTEPQAREKAEKEGFEISIAKTSFKANTKALAENEGEGLAKLIYRPDTGEILGVHILGLHAADLIHEASNAIALGTRIQDIKFAVHAHPTLSEVLDELFKSAKVNSGVSHSVNEPVAV